MTIFEKMNKKKTMMVGVVIHAESTSTTDLELRERVRLNLLQKWFKSN